MCQVKQIIGIVYINVILIFKIYDFDAKGVNSSVLKKKKKEKRNHFFQKVFCANIGEGVSRAVFPRVQCYSDQQ